MQIFGQAKAEKQAVLKAISTIIQKFDIIAVQEIRDKNETAIISLLSEINTGSKKYSIVISPRLGRTSSKEQYAFIFDTSVLNEEMESSVWPDFNDEFEREPFIAKFKSVAGNFDFVMIDIHTKPDDAKKEISLLPSIMKYGTLQYGESDVLCLGDFNADGTYFNERMYEEIFPSTEYNWVIDNSADTSVAKDSNTYDRIVTSKSMDEDYTGNWGVFNFIEEGLVQQFYLSANEISDHFPIWASYSINNDTD